VDPKLVEATYSAASTDFDEFGEDLSFFADFEPYLERLPPKEYDLIELYFKRGKRQKDIAVLFGVSQGAISHRIARAKERLQFLKDLPKVSDHMLKAKLRESFEPMDVDIVFWMTQTTCQSKVAKMINEKYHLKEKQAMTQVKVRHKFYKAIELLALMASKDSLVAKIHDLTLRIQANPYMLHEVILPHFDKGKRAILCHT
jgi:predicted DNA-binding protein YlxM (UPF0122 family)